MWAIEYRKVFLKDLARINLKGTREKIETLVFDEIPNLKHPFDCGKIERMEGYKGSYKIRVGHYRIGLKIDMSAKILEFRRILHRKDMYRYFP
ncbi:MAG: type II toxin-antitoxin system RelE/ParE family toxin [Candidatus Latescibacteria bacterium]|nr:type II toxin-antitoxin system RelE/ParE family toxin [Candidatus Latescibacterota bacterium]